MVLNENEKSLLHFVSCNCIENTSKESIFSVLEALNIKFRFMDTSPVYQIIDELEFRGMTNVIL